MIATVMWYTEAKDAAKHFIIHRTVTTTKNHTVQKINSAEVEESCCEGTCIIFLVRTADWNRRETAKQDGDAQVKLPSKRHRSIQASHCYIIMNPTEKCKLKIN